MGQSAPRRLRRNVVFYERVGIDDHFCLGGPWSRRAVVCSRSMGARAGGIPRDDDAGKVID
jgi:hypothetical protein